MTLQEQETLHNQYTPKAISPRWWMVTQQQKLNIHLRVANLIAVKNEQLLSYPKRKPFNFYAIKLVRYSLII